MRPVDTPDLGNPPIKEAVVEYRFAHTVDPAAADLRHVGQEFHEAFPTEERLFEGTVSLLVSQDGLTPSEPEGALRGFRFISADRSRAVAFTQGSMAFSRFAQYAGRDRLLSEVKGALDEYLRLLPDSGTDTTVTRLGVRYINHIAIPDGHGASIHLDDYIAGLPEPVIDDPVTRISVDRQTRSDVRGENSRLRLVGPIRGEEEGTSISFVLDIDVWRDVQFHVGHHEAIDQALGNLFDLRSQLFLRSLGQKALERYR